jgi:acyl-coenzyme A thioesterase PaaI-like protein
VKLDIRSELTPDSLKDADMCFGCGQSNPIGLKLKFSWDDNSRTASAEFVPGENLQGWAGFVHGGVTACVLDEAIGWAALFSGYTCVTARIQVRFRKMIPVNQPFTVLCTVTSQDSRFIKTEAKIIDYNGHIFAEGTSTQYIVGSQENVIIDHAKQED